MRLYLLLTGTVDSGVYNNTGNLIRDVNERLCQYETSITKYICETPFTDIVFIENSGFDFDRERFCRLADEHDKRFEFINGKICKEEILAHGKSFGDAYLISEALQKSKLLRDCKFFYKITGRIFLKNSHKICKTAYKYRNEFIIYTANGWCLTNIFKVNRDDYMKYLSDIYNDCDEASVSDIEISFYRRLTNLAQSGKMRLDSFKTYPYFDGIMGATGRNYSGGKPERIARNIMAKINCFKYNSKSSIVIKIVMRLKGKKFYQ